MATQQATKHRKPTASLASRQGHGLRALLTTLFVFISFMSLKASVGSRLVRVIRFPDELR